MFSFSLITPQEGDLSFKASLLSFDNEFKILADPSWDGKDSDIVLFMEQHLSEVNAVLLSHSTPDFISGYVLLCLKFPNLMSTMPVYSTLPVNQLGRISTVEYYRAKGILGPLNSSILEIDEVDNWFDKITLLKYQQSTSLLDNKVTITPYNSGHTLGGAFWLIVKRIDKVIYAPAWNHSKDSFLNSASFISTSTGNPLLSLLRPTAFITAPDLGSTMPHKRRTEKFLQLVDATLSNGGAALLPTSLSGRFLELFHLIDEHLQGAPIPVYFLSYSGTRILSYASNLVDWMSGSFIKSWDESTSESRGGGKALSSMPFDPSKVDLLLDPSELIQLSGPKIVFCSGIDIQNGDISAQTFQYLCNNENTTVILTEKSQLDQGLNSILYKEWYKLTKLKLGGKVEDGTAVPLEKSVSIDSWTREINLEGRELSDFQERITQQRKEKLLAKVRDKKNQNLLNAETVDDEDSSEDEEEGHSSDEEQSKTETIKSSTVTVNSIATATSTVAQSVVDELAAHEAFVMDHIKQSLKDNIPIDLKITHRLRPRSAMFPYFMTARKVKFDDYGQVIDANDFEKTEEASNAKIIMEGKKKFDEKRRWNEDKEDPTKKNQNKQQANKLTPQEQLNQQLIQRNLDTLYNPRKRVPLNAASSFAPQIQMLKIRCGLSFVDLSGLVDLRSLGIIVQALKPYNLLLLPDFNSLDSEINGLKQVQEMFDHQQNEQIQEESKKKILASTRYLSLSSIRSGLSSAISTYGSSKMNVLVVEPDKPLKIGTESESGGVGLNNFEINLDDSIVKNLKWQKIGSNYRVAKVQGELELQNNYVGKKRQRTLNDYINPTTYFTLKKSEDESLRKRRQVLDQKLQDPKLKALVSNGPKLAIGNIRLPDLRKNLQEKNMNAEFKQEGTLVVNDILTIRKVAYGASESDDSGDIIIEGNVSPLYYQVKECIREMLAYV